MTEKTVNEFAYSIQRGAILIVCQSADAKYPAVLSDKKYKNDATRLQKEFAQYNAPDLITKTVNYLLSLKDSDELSVTVGSQG